MQGHFTFDDRWLLVANRFELTALEDALGWIDNVAVLVPLTLSDRSAESVIEVRKSFVYTQIRVPTAQGKQGKWPQNSCQGKHRNLEILPKHRKTQGIGFAQVVNSLTLKVKDISIFFYKTDKSANSVLCMK